MRSERRPGAAFHGELESHELGGAIITSMHTVPVRVVRGPPELATMPLEAYYVGHQVDGPCIIDHAGTSRMVESGGVGIVDTTRPSSAAFDHEFTCIVAVVPHHLLRPRLDDPEGALRQLIRGGTSEGSLLASYLAAIARVELATASADAACNILLDLLALALNAAPNRTASNDRSARDARRRAIATFIESHLGDPSLQPATIAAHFRISPRYLDTLFAEIGTSVMRHVLARRLDRARGMLRDPARSARTITDLALDLGFRDPSYFGRAFKAAFGVTPRDWRSSR